MPTNGKKYRNAVKLREKKPYLLPEAVAGAKKLSYAKFDESVDMSFVLGVDPKHADQMVRGTVVLPHGTGRTKRVAVVASGEKLKEAAEAGAEIYGEKDLIEKISKGFIDFDALIATPDVMKDVGKLGKVLGPRGLMPNPKAGTVTFDVKKAITEIKAGKVEFRVDKNGIIHAPIGRVSFEPQKLAENGEILILAILRARPSAAKGKYFKNVYVSTTMGPSFKIDTAPIEKSL